MSSLLEDCPGDIIELMVRLLALKDICSLRQSSRTLAAKIKQGHHFESYFRSKHVDITSEALQAFVDQTQPAGLGCLIQDLVLVGVVNNTEKLKATLVNPEYCNANEQEKVPQDLLILEERQIAYRQLHESGMDVDLPTQALRNLASNSKTGKLLSLSLKVVVYRENAVERQHPLAGGSWRLIWGSAIDTFRSALCSLAQSNLLIEKLSIFNDRHLQRCSIFYDELESIDFKNKGLARSLASLKSLSVSFSNRHVSCSEKHAELFYDPAEDMGSAAFNEERNIDDVKTEAANMNNYMGLAKLLKLSSNIENLELQQYFLDTEGHTLHDDLQIEQILQRAAEMKQPPILKRMELRGLWVNEKGLLTFVRRTEVRKLMMYDVVMSSGTFRPVFDYCSSNFAGMEELFFSRLHEDRLKVWFDEPANSEFSQLIGTSTGCRDGLLREGDQVKQQISYRTRRVICQLSSRGNEMRLEKWLEKCREYGPGVV